MRECHLPAYRSMGWQVVRIANRTLETARRRRPTSSTSPRPRTTSSTSSATSASRSWTSRCRSHLHREVAEAAIAAGKHVLLQKPMATTLEDARAIVEAAEQAGVKLAVNQNGRWDPAIRACRELLDRGVFGPLVTASIEMRTRQPWQDYWKDAEHYPRLMLLGMSIHHLDQFRFLFGDPEDITAFTGDLPGAAVGRRQHRPVRPALRGRAAGHGLRRWLPLDARLERGLPHRRAGRHRPRHHRLAHGDFSTLEYTTRDRPDSWLRPAFTRKWFPDAFVGTMGELFRAIETDTEPSISGPTTCARCVSSRPATARRPSAARSGSRRYRARSELGGGRATCTKRPAAAWQGA